MTTRFGREPIPQKRSREDDHGIAVDALLDLLAQRIARRHLQQQADEKERPGAATASKPFDSTRKQ